MKRLIVVLSALALTGAACTAGSQQAAPQKVSAKGPHKPVTITFWTGWTAREYHGLQRIIDGFEKKYPWITVKTVPGVTANSDTKLIAAINGGNPPDAASSFIADDVGKFCSTGAFLNLKPYLEQDNVDPSIFPPSTTSYTQYKGVQCTLPFLTDDFGLYYNKTLLAKAGYHSPPKTIGELTAMAKKITQFNPDGSIKVAGFVPLISYYEGDIARYAVSWGAKFFDSSGKSQLSRDPAWSEMLRWQKSFVDWYGYDKLTAFQAGLGEEFSPSNPFETGKVAMALDGEWRTAFIANEHPQLKYGTAPFPAADNHPEQYGASVVGGTILGIPRGSKHPAEGWLLIKYLGTNTNALVSFANLIHNVPTTKPALSSPRLNLGPTFDTFMRVFKNPKSGFLPMTPAGTVEDTLANSFVTKWEAGKVLDLQAGLKTLDQQIDNQIQQG